MWGAASRAWCFGRRFEAGLSPLAWPYGKLELPPPERGRSASDSEPGGGQSMSRFNRTREKTEIARKLRRNETDVERRLWHRLRSGQICDVHFRRQHPAGRYILDFYCPALALAVELDGGQHAETGM